jgi:hypothetical protein
MAESSPAIQGMECSVSSIPKAMLDDAAPSSPADQAELQNPEHGLPESFGAGWRGRLLFWIAVSFSIFQIVTSFGVPLDRPLVGDLTLIWMTAAALVVWAGYLVLLRLRGRPVLDGLFAIAAVALAFGIVEKFGGSLPSQVVRTIHV